MTKSKDPELDALHKRIVKAHDHLTDMRNQDRGLDDPEHRAAIDKHGALIEERINYPGAELPTDQGLHGSSNYIAAYHEAVQLAYAGVKKSRTKAPANELAPGGLG